MWRYFSGRLLSFWQRIYVRWTKKYTVICLVLLPCSLMIINSTHTLIFENPVKRSIIAPGLVGSYFVTADNTWLPARSWLPENHPVKAVIIALHGFNDYSNFFAEPGEYFKNDGIASYAYDQRCFGGAPERGDWEGTDIMARDLADFTRLIRTRHPGVPIYLLGESMGAAVVIVAMTSNTPPLADGVILSAPAIWTPDSVPWYQQVGLWLAGHTVPWLQLTGSSLHLVPSDNINMLRMLIRDPLVLKETRIGTAYGLVDLMAQAFKRAKRMAKPTLVLYGQHDEIVPKRFVYLMLDTVPYDRDWHVALYENGYHLLLRDLGASQYWQDIAAWIANPRQRLPSGADKQATKLFLWVGFGGSLKHAADEKSLK